MIQSGVDLASADLTGDGVPELVYRRISGSTGGDITSIQIWEQTQKGLQKIPFRYSAGVVSDGMRQIEIPIILGKTGDTRLRITQPECDVTVEVEISMDKFDHLGFDGDEYGPIDSQVRSETISIVIDEETGREILCMIGKIGDKWSTIGVKWKMLFEDNVWKVIGFTKE